MFKKNMPAKDSQETGELQKGQLWSMDGQYLHVAEVGKLLIHYRMLRSPDQKASATKIANRTEVLDFLSRRHASLLKKADVPESKPDTGL